MKGERYVSVEAPMFVRANNHRGGFAPPPLNDYELEAPRDVGLMIRASVREAFGVAGMRAWDDLNPGFVDAMTATLIEVRAEGAWSHHVEGSVERSREAWAGIGRMLSAALRASPTDDARDTALRALAANAGIEDGDVDALLQGRP